MEMHYTVQELALLVRFSERFIRERIRDGSFGAGAVYMIHGDLRIKASAAQAWMDQHEYKPPGIFARNEGELRRKMIQQEKNAA